VNSVLISERNGEAAAMETDQVATTSAKPVIEDHGYEYVPLSERHGKPGPSFFVWFGASHFF
jgi:hypothetical protein